MKTITKILAALLFVQWAYSCVSDSPAETTPPAETDTPKHPITVKAYLPSTAESRAQIKYNWQDTTREVFMWNHKDYFTVFNITRLSERPNGLELETTEEKIHGNIAEFESLEGYPDFTVKAGDIIFANLHETKRKYGPDGINFDDRNIFTIGVGSEENRPQYIKKNPDDSSLAYMNDNLKMYDIVVAEKDGELPELHFKHLSALMRVTLRNATGKDIYPTKLEFKYPSVTGIESFFNTTLYLSVTGDNPDNLRLIAYDTDDLFKGSEPYTANIGTTINGKDGVEDSGEPIPNGDSYELYLSTVPRLYNDSYGNSLTIQLIADHKTKRPFSITLEGFNVVITAGKRYWFDLTATPDSTLMLTSQWRKLHPDSTGGETTPEN